MSKPGQQKAAIFSAKFGTSCEHFLARLQAFDARQKQKDFQPAENSVPLRLVAALMSFLVITLACFYADVSLMQTIVYLILSVMGSYLAYLCRAKRSTVLSWVTITGVLIVMGIFGQEVFAQFYIGRLNLLAPFIVAVVGLQVLHMFDLRTRTDINTSAIIGLGCLAAAATIGQDIAYGVGVLLYIFLCASLLYLQCLEANTDGVVRAVRSGELVEPSPGGLPVRARGSAGSAILMTSSLPIAALFVFLNIPHIESFLDQLMTSTLAGYLPVNMTVSASATAPAGYGDSSGRSHNYIAVPSGAPVSKDVPGTRQVREDSQAKKGRKIQFPAGFNHSLGAAQTTAQKVDKPAATNERSSEVSTKYSLADRATEEEMTLNYAGKSAIAGEDRLLFIIRSSREVFLRRLAFDTFDGHDWKVAGKRAEEYYEIKSPDIYTEIKYEALKQSNLRGMDITQEIDAVAELGHIVPAAWAPKMVAIPAESILVDDTGTIRVKEEMPAGTKFRIVSKVPFYDLDVLRGTSVSAAQAAATRRLLKADLQIPASQGDQAALLAHGLTGSAGSWFEQAEKICQYLRNNFQYAIDVAPPKKAENLVNYFLFKAKKGDCSHFASAFVILCRSLGIPARCVGGFAPGERNYVTGNFEIHATQAHAWGEIYLPSVGWIPFDPVPDGYLPAARPDRGLIASMMRSDQVRSLYQSFDSFIKSSVKSQETASLPTASNKTGSGSKFGEGAGLSIRPSAEASSTKGKAVGTGGVSDGGLRLDGMGQTGKSPISSGPATQLGMPIPSGQGGRHLSVVGAAGRRSALPGLPWGSSVKELFRGLNPIWFFENWAKVAAGVALVVAAGILFYRLRVRTLARKAVAYVDIARPSTLAYLKVIDDLAEIKFVRGLSDTPQEVVEKVSRIIEKNDSANANRLSELPEILSAFVDKYVSTRFVEEESPQLRAELVEIGNKIHVLLTSRAK